MSPVFSEEDKIVTVTLHSFLIVIYQDDATLRIIKHRAGHPQGFVDVW
jgi:hypothetical protein